MYVLYVCIQCVPCWFVQRLSKFALNKPKQTANEREIDWARAITWVCPSGRVMYICENRLSCPRKAKSVFASTLCWSAEPLKVALKVKMISTVCFITYLEWISVFERAVERTVKDRPLPPPCGATMKLHWLTARLELASEISTEKVSCQSDSRIRTMFYIYIYYANNRLTILLSGLCFVMWTVILSFSSVYLTSCFNAI